MSRSYKHNPVVKSARDLSNREFKTEAHQKFRREARKALAALMNAGEDFVFGAENFPQHMREVSEIQCSKQERWPMFYDYWADVAERIAQRMTIRPYYTRENAREELRWAKRTYIRNTFK